ncbi:MAG: 30S ribosomal protein S6 [Candidatus Omnitrophota bacterium]|nr:30S ribosomal protein S6 [Candidatus Omnitrophota bacterium]MBU1929785.1 30S ribosomal protein S6 [Candidatus Omnitrophota bacterium]MBU2035213.1 30S ribosomal protein S6 [Candidatus Omnitrophota bacterium]MBU2221275.1 30S ribosomal protein S6 [Candidatus Omnitrophota bacterium]MBU2257813.1 30S ribosomal protein S6 [Candidatus Omnitrophota bacterium]
MNKYEAMFIIKPDLSEEDKKLVFEQIAEAITKNSGKISQAAVWSEKKKLAFSIKKFQEGTYYLVNFDLGTQALEKIRYAYKLNESIIRLLIIKIS